MWAGPGGLSGLAIFVYCVQVYKIHGWGQAPISQEIATAHAVGKRVGGRMDLMLDPACEYITFGDALKVGWACDEQRVFWYEDP